MTVPSHDPLAEPKLRAPMDLSRPQTRLVVERQTNHYPVQGECAWQVLRGVENSGFYLDLSRAQTRALGQARGMVSWSIDWKGWMHPPGHRLEGEDGQDGEILSDWRLSECDVLVKVSLNYPRWKLVPLRSKNGFRRWLRLRLIRHWLRFRTGLVRYAEGHARIVVEAGESMRVRLLDLPDASNKEALVASINALNKEVERECRKEQQHYDCRTHCGLFQGASWNSQWYVLDSEAKRIT
jgi:hypothetical protein